MSVNIEKLEMNVNFHALQTNFRNAELHYVIAESEDNFRFAEWHDEPGEYEEKFYCFLTEQDLFIPAGNVVLKESYVVTDKPAYAEIATPKDVAAAIEALANKPVAKALRRFYNEDIELIREELEEKFGEVEKHVVTSQQGQHTLLVVQDVEVSIAATMVYFRRKPPFSDSHYNNVLTEGGVS